MRRLLRGILRPLARNFTTRTSCHAPNVHMRTAFGAHLCGHMRLLALICTPARTSERARMTCKLCICADVSRYPGEIELAKMPLNSSQWVHASVSS